MAPAAPLTTRDLNRATLARQGLIGPIRGSAADAVRRVGSLQAQHPEWPPVALAARAGTARAADLARALTQRRVVRSFLMRLTIHVVHAEDLWPMFTVVQPLRLNQWRLLLKSDPIDSALGRRMKAAHAVAIDAGTWELARADGSAAIRLHPFGRLPRGTRQPLLAEAERLLGLLAPDGMRRSVRIGA